MYPVSPELKKALLGVSTIVNSLVAKTDFETVELEVHSGTITEDATAETRWTLSAEVAGGDDIYRVLTSPSCVLIASMGAMVGGSPQLVPKGQFMLDADVLENDDLSLSISGADLSRKIARSKYLLPWAIAKDTLATAAIRSILVKAWPALDDKEELLDLGDSTATIATAINFDSGESSNPWLDAIAVAKSVGLTLYVDARGVFKTKPAGDSTQPVWAFGANDNFVLTSSNRKALISEVYNTVVVTGEGADVSTPVQGVAQDVDEQSPTNINGAFGIAPKYITSALVTTVEQATTMAVNELAKCKGLSEAGSFGQVPLYFLEADDCISHTRENGTTKIYVFDRISTPFGVADDSAADAREVRSNG